MHRHALIFGLGGPPLQRWGTRIPRGFVSPTAEAMGHSSNATRKRRCDKALGVIPCRENQRLFLKRALGHQLAAPLPELSSTDALAAVKSIGIAELSLNGRTTRLVSGGGRDARRVLSALGIKDLEPPTLRDQRKEPEI